jgi:hypothetical protein|tara:strand:- start:619 stop:723 length:105 start_codon:yes stop_codon:yes gene_type:complete
MTPAAMDVPLAAPGITPKDATRTLNRKKWSGSAW